MGGYRADLYSTSDFARPLSMEKTKLPIGLEARNHLITFILLVVTTHAFQKELVRFTLGSDGIIPPAVEFVRSRQIEIIHVGL